MKLGEIARIKHGWAFKGELFADELTGLPIVVNIGNFAYSGGFRFESTTVKEYRGSYPREFELEPHDVIVVMTCQTAGGEILGIPGRIPDDGRTYLHNQRMGRVEILRPDLVDDAWLYWLFLTPQLNRWLAMSATGTKILHTSPGRIAEFAVPLPPLDIQQSMASVFDALQAKIELNRRLSETQEALASALFRSWFIDFDPVRAKVEGRNVGMPPPLADLFPESFTDSPSGQVPLGWTVAGLDEIARFLNGLAMRKSTRGRSLAPCDQNRPTSGGIYGRRRRGEC